MHASSYFVVASMKLVLRECRARVDIITRMHLRMRASNWHVFCDNAEGFARMCLILCSINFIINESLY